jgi:branched-chain amino acid aminotransferase
MTHGFNYGTAVFEGIRAYWNADEEQLFGLELVPHYERIRSSAALLMMEVRQSAEELADITVELLRRDGLREDVYLRPIVYKSSETIGVRLHNLDADITIFGVPFGQYIDTDGGIRAQVSSWRRTDDNAIPARGKITGAYVNGALAKSEAQLNGFDEAIVLTADGHVSEGSAENLFIVKRGVLITPAVTDNILEGITRRRLIAIARADMGHEVVERTIDRTELYGADEVFLCGTGAQISPVIEIDRRTIGSGRPGPITREMSRTYFDAVRGRLPAYRDWLTPVY